jgi:membrane-anchored protein YejM (alkaline phosphatase superfamily)
MIPKELTHHFTPSWEDPKYLELNNKLDPTPFFNLYRNNVYVIDSLVGKVLQALEDRQLMERTMIVVTGDHGQEFNENKKNYWGHSSNYSRAQVGTPLIVYYPGIKPEERHYRTTHYDIVPTVLKQVLGVKNPPSDYSMGYLLDDPQPRRWQYVGKVLDWAFIADDDVIIEKNGNGTVDIFDKHMTPLYDYPLNGKELNDALQNLRRFIK